LLQEQRFERLGGNETIQTDVRVLAATNKDLEEAVGHGRLPPDLFYRLNGFTTRPPPPRDPPADPPPLVGPLGQHRKPPMGKQVRTVAPEVMPLLEAHDWPGNVRELQSTIRFALVHATGEVLTADCLPDSVRPESAPSRPPQGAPDSCLPTLAQVVHTLLR